MDSKQLPPPHNKDHAMSTVIISSSDRCGICGLHKSWTREIWYFTVLFPDFPVCEDCFQGLDVLQLPPSNSLLMCVLQLPPRNSLFMCPDWTLFMCDGQCSYSVISTERWCCKVCPDFDLCDVCYKNMDVHYDLHTVGHPMSAIAASRNVVKYHSSENIVVHPPKKSCSGCKTSPIWSQRLWKCNVCVDYYLCEGCYVVMGLRQLPPPHNRDHAMSAVVISSSDHCGGCGLHRSWTPQYWCCDVCPNIFLCEECYQGRQVAHELPPPHNKDHLMFVKVTIANCGGCKSYPIFTDRWRCKVCLDFDLCEICYRELDFNQLPASHTRDHPKVCLGFLYELCYRESDSNQLFASHTRDHPMSVIVSNVMEWYGQDWTEPSFKKPAATEWSYRVSERDLHGFQWKRRVPPPSVMDQGDDMLASPTEQANITSTLSDTGLDVERPMLVEGRENVVAELGAWRTSSTAKEDSKYPNRKSWSLSPCHKVFLSHAGPQKDFVEQLHKDLIGVHRDTIFFDKDKECLPEGLKFAELIVQAARQCELAVVVMSEDYFIRKWPMIELSAFVDAQKTRPELNILPLFYELSVEEFKQDERQRIWLECWEKWSLEDPRINIQNWKDSLKALSSTKGIQFVKAKGQVSYRAEIVKAICGRVTLHIRADDSHIQGKVRMSMMIQKELGLCNELLRTTPPTPQFVGMYGMAGMGKTTLCRLVRDDLVQVFDGKACHVELGNKSALELQHEVLQQLTALQEVTIKLEATDTLKGLSLLKERMPRYKVFLAIDNVWDTPESLKEAEDYLSVPLKEGSVVLVTARTIDILKKLRNSWQCCFQVPDLQKEEATILFAQHAKCNRAKLSRVEKKQMESFVKGCHFTTGRNAGQYHPLALKVLGGRVGADSSIWKDIVVDFKRVDHERRHPIFSILRSSYDALIDRYQVMFVDMVLYANSMQHTGEILTVDHLNELFYHLDDDDSSFVANFVRVVQTKSLVEVIDSRWVQVHDLYRDFVKMETESVHRKTCQLYARGSGRLFQKGWLTNFDPKLTILAKENLCHCSEAKILIMRNCKNLMELDVRGMKNLTILEHKCFSSKLIKARVEDVDTLVSLKLDIWGGGDFPSLAGLKSLRQLELSCQKDFMMPSWRRTKDLEVQQPFEFCLCTNLEKLTLQNHKKLLELPQLGLFKQLTDLKIWDYDKIEELAGLEALSSLRALDLRRLSSLKEIPHLRCFPHLLDVTLQACQLITGVLGLAELTSLEAVDLSDCILIKVLPNMHKCTNLIRLDISNTSIEEILGIEHMSGITKLICCSKFKGLPHLSTLHSLETLCLRDCPTIENLENIGELPALRELDVSGCRNLAMLPDLRGLQLTKLGVSHTSVNNIPGLDHSTQLKLLYCSGTKLSGLPNLSNLHNLWFLEMSRCSAVESLENIGYLPALQEMNVSGCRNLRKLPDFSGCQLERLKLSAIIVTQIPGIDHCLQLQELYCSGTSLTHLPDLSNLLNLVVLYLDGCSALQKLDNIGKLPALISLNVRGCPSLVELPDLSYSKLLEKLDMSNSPLVDPNQVKLFGNPPLIVSPKLKGKREM